MVWKLFIMLSCYLFGIVALINNNIFLGILWYITGFWWSIDWEGIYKEKENGVKA